ncbi:hypothetical protein DDW13_06850 [Acidianus hospitalis]|uniref:Uncharacterized protein n=1 Tax=Acidianus hospitalis TaxID=563177 RepID=A0A2T9X3H1_9CREN|nr:hypothetical protein DDW13_06850 [Acidianus hospitalis]
MGPLDKVVNTYLKLGVWGIPQSAPAGI